MIISNQSLNSIGGSGQKISKQTNKYEQRYKERNKRLGWRLEGRWRTMANQFYISGHRRLRPQG
jgi:hypothetical protein